MKHRLLAYSLVSFLLFLAIFGAQMLWQTREDIPTTVSFLDIGQGDATLIQQGSNQILIDGGKDKTLLLSRLGEIMPVWDRTIELVIATHPDTDHIGGLLGIIKTMSVKHWLQTGVVHDSTLFRRLNEEIAQHNIPVHTAVAGVRVVLPSNSGELIVLYPQTSIKGNVVDNNAYSVVVLFSYGQEQFLLTGDLPAKKEELLVVTDEVDVLKAGHHGSKTSTSQHLLNRTTPRDVVISVGAKNAYGHPHKETLSRLSAAHIRTLETAKNGTITYICSRGECHYRSSAGITSQ